MPLIEEALRLYWDDIFPDGAPPRPEYWTEVARKLVRRATKAPHGRPIKFPKEETVRKHLPVIYARVLGEKGGP